MAIDIHVDGGDNVEIKNNMFYENEIGVQILNYASNTGNTDKIAITDNVFLSSSQYAINSAITGESITVDNNYFGDLSGMDPALTSRRILSAFGAAVTIPTTPLTQLTCTSANCETCYANIGVASGETCLKCKTNYQFNENGACAAIVTSENCAEYKSGSSECISCKEPYFMLELSSCIRECPAGYYGEISGSRTCKECHEKCKTCTGSLETTCTTCREGLSMDYATNECKSCHDFTDASNNCLAKCPDNYYTYQQSVSCSYCPTGCLHCNVDETCITCEKGWFMNDKKTCTKCDVSCSACSSLI